MVQRPTLTGSDFHGSRPANSSSDRATAYRNVAVEILGLEAERVFARWAQTDLAIQEALLLSAKRLEMFEELLALGLWRLSQREKRPEMGLDPAWLKTFFKAARFIGRVDAAFLLDRELYELEGDSAERLLDVAFLHADRGETEEAMRLLHVVRPSPQRQQILLETLVEAKSPEAGFVLAALLRNPQRPTKKRLWQMRPAIARAEVLTSDEYLLGLLIETCDDESLPFILACAVDAGLISTVDRSVLGRLSFDKEFWSALIGRTTAEARYRAMAELSALYLPAGMGGVSLGDYQARFTEAGPLPSLSAFSRLQSALDKKVTAIICAFDSQATIEHALRSVCSQGYKDLDVIVVDDCSKVPLRLDPDWFMGRDVTLHRNETNLGPYLSRNIGIDMSDADFISFHDADDWMHPDKITHQMLELEKTGAIAHYGSVVRIRPDGLITPENNGRFLGDGPITGIFRREAFERSGRFAAVRTRGDIEFRRRLVARLGEHSVASNEVPYVLALDWESNSKRQTRRQSDWKKVSDFLKHSEDVRPLARFATKSHLLHQLINETMALSLRGLGGANWDVVNDEE